MSLGNYDKKKYVDFKIFGKKKSYILDIIFTGFTGLKI